MMIDMGKIFMNVVQWRARRAQQRRVRTQLAVMHRIRAARYRGIERQLHPRPVSPAEQLRQRKIRLKEGYFARRYRR